MYCQPCDCICSRSDFVPNAPTTMYGDHSSSTSSTSSKMTDCKIDCLDDDFFRPFVKERIP